MMFLLKLDQRLSQRLQLNRKCNACSTSFNWQKGQIRRFSGVFSTVCPPVSICNSKQANLPPNQAFVRYLPFFPWKVGHNLTMGRIS